MDIKAIKQEIKELPMAQLQAAHNILEFNLRGLLIGSKSETALKLGLIKTELERRKLKK